MNVSELAGAARQQIERRGWHQGNLEGENGGVCVMGGVYCGLYGESGIFLASSIYHLIDQVVLDFSDKFVELTDKTPAAFNDDPHHSVEDILLVLKQMEVG